MNMNISFLTDRHLKSLEKAADPCLIHNTPTPPHLTTQVQTPALAMSEMIPPVYLGMRRIHL